jgi:hypothetical protein
VNDHRTLLARLDEARVPKDREMVGHGRAWQPFRRCTAAGQALAPPFAILVERSNDRETHRVGQGVEHACKRDILQIWMSELGHAPDIEEDS